MNKKIRKELIKLFILSIEKDIENWTNWKATITNGAEIDVFISPCFDKYYFKVDTYDCCVCMCSVDGFPEQVLCKYKLFGFITINTKVYLSIVKLKKDNLKMGASDIFIKNFYKEYTIDDSVKTFINNFIKSVYRVYNKEYRKEKLRRICI